MNKLLLLCLLALPSCGAISSIQSAADKISAVADSLSVKVSDIDKAANGVTAVAGQLGDKGTAIVEKVQAVQATIHAADKDQNGVISGWGEISGLVLALIALVKSWLSGATAAKAQTATDELYDLHVQNAKAIATATAATKVN